MERIAARGEMYHAHACEDMRAAPKREFLVLEIGEDLGDRIRALSKTGRLDFLGRLDDEMDLALRVNSGRLT